MTRRELLVCGVVYAAMMQCAVTQRCQAGLLVVNADGNSISRAGPGGSVTPFASLGLKFPLQIAIDSSGNVYATNGNDGTVHRFSATGADLGTFASVPSGAGGLAFGSSGKLFVGAWFGDGAIHEFSSAGGDLGIFAQLSYNDPNIGFGPANFFAVAFDPQGNLVATDDFFGRLYRFAPDGSLVTNMSLASFGLAVDSVGNIFVGGADGNIHKVSNTGTDLGDFASNLGGIVSGLAFDDAGNLYASVYDTGVIEKFASDGTDLGVFASGLSGPAGLVFEPQSVPEPGWLMMLLGLGGSLLRARFINRREGARLNLWPVRSGR